MINEHEMERFLRDEELSERDFVGSDDEKNYYLDRIEEFLELFGIELYDDFGFSIREQFWLLEPTKKTTAPGIAFAAAQHVGQLRRMIISINIRQDFFFNHYNPYLIFGLEESE